MVLQGRRQDEGEDYEDMEFDAEYMNEEADDGC